jgi:mRNA interferase MazF
MELLYIPKRGDVVWITLAQKNVRRLAVVVSPEAYHRKTGLALFCPVTASIKNYPFEVVLPEGMPVRGAVLPDQVKSLDWQAGKIEFVCELTDSLVREVIQKLGTLLE